MLYRSILAVLALSAIFARGQGWVWKGTIYEGNWHSGRKLEVESESLEGCINLGNRQLCEGSSDCVGVVANAGSINTANSCVRVYSEGDCSGDSALMEIRPSTICHGDWSGCGIKGKIKSIGGCPHLDPDFNHTSSAHSSNSYASSTNWPGNYNDSENTNWIMTAPVGAKIRMNFESWEIEDTDRCKYDRLVITELITDEILLIGCGDEMPSPVVSKSNQVRVNFISDGSVNKKGFRIKWDRVPASVHTSANFPSNYPDNEDRTEGLSAPVGKRIHISFNVFDIEESSSCSYDKLTIYDGSRSNVLFEGCGSDLPAPIVSKGNVVIFHFKSDGSVNKKGFSVNLVDV